MAHPKAPVNFSTPRNAAKHGRFGDSLIAFLSPEAQSFLTSKDNVLGTINPLTGLPEYAEISEEDSFANDKWVTDMYTQVFDRDVDAGGLDYWSDQKDSGTSQEDIMKSWVASDEYQNKMMDTGFTLDTAFDDILGRAPDAAGEAYYQDQFDTTATTYDDIINSMFGSDEFKTNNTQAAAADVTEAVSNLDDTSSNQTANSYQDDDGTFSLDGANDMVENWYGEHSVNDGDTAGNEYWAGQLDNATSASDITSIEQSFLTALSNDNGIDSDSGAFIADTSFLNDDSGYVEATADTANTYKDADGSLTLDGASDMVENWYGEHSVNDGDEAGSAYWTDQLDAATTTPEILAIEQAFLTALSNDKGIDSDSGDFITDTSFLTEGGGYVDTTADTADTGDTGDTTTLTETEKANIAAGLNADGSTKITNTEIADDFRYTLDDGSVWSYDPATKTPIMISGPTTKTGDTGDDAVVNNLLNADGSTRTTAELLALGFNAQGVAFTETEQANIANGLNPDGTPKTTTLTDDIIAKALYDKRLKDGKNPETGEALTATQLANIEAGRLWNVDATVVADSSDSDKEETKETVVIAGEDGGTDAINLVNEALLGKSNLEEIMALLDRGNLRDLGVRYLRAIRDKQGNRIFYNLNPTEFNQNRNQLRRLYWGKTWKAVDNAEEDTGYGNRAAATTNFLGGA